ncbi:hypothetical protein [Rhodococcus sp. YH1]|uniref:hypothetical protein n=1 Tax=Rhodococcus sp. YH1 TaxID=89066 RepID=UPI001386A90B|nr:hypothetical protein [Rhodococcus sp. YH1]
MTSILETDTLAALDFTPRCQIGRVTPWEHLPDCVMPAAWFLGVHRCRIPPRLAYVMLCHPHRGEVVASRYAFVCPCPKVFATFTDWAPVMRPIT